MWPQNTVLRAKSEIWAGHQAVAARCIIDAGSLASVLRAKSEIWAGHQKHKTPEHLGCSGVIISINNQNVLFLRWHYPDQVHGSEVSTPHLSQLDCQHPVFNCQL